MLWGTCMDWSSPLWSWLPFCTAHTVKHCNKTISLKCQFPNTFKPQKAAQLLPDSRLWRSNAKDAQFAAWCKEIQSLFNSRCSPTAVNDEVSFKVLKLIRSDAFVVRSYKNIHGIKYLRDLWLLFHIQIAKLPNFSKSFLLASCGSDIVTRLCPWRWRAAAQRFPMIPAPWISMLIPTLMGLILSQPWAKHDNGSVKAAVNWTKINGN